MVDRRTSSHHIVIVILVINTYSFFLKLTVDCKYHEKNGNDLEDSFHFLILLIFKYIIKVSLACMQSMLILITWNLQITSMSINIQYTQQDMDINPIDAPKVPQDFHVKLRKRFYEKFISIEGNSSTFKSSICFFKGIETIPKNHEDTNHFVEQQSTFWYLFGVKQTDCYAIIHNDTGQTTLFVPRLDEAYKMWMYVKPVETFKQQVGAKQVLFVDELEEFLSKLNVEQIYLYSGQNSDSKLNTLDPEQKYLKYGKKVNKQSLWTIIGNLRAIKTQQQIQLMKYVCKVATDAHIKVMKSCKPGLTQIQMHALFNFEHTVHCGCKNLAFQSICSSGRDCATLHYIENDKVIEAGQLILHDMGGKWYGYCADQAITFPVDGKFTQKQKVIYNAVYEAQQAVLNVAKPGVGWTQMHLLAEKVIIQHLLEAGILNKYPVQQIQKKRIGAIFFPHGLGHLLGLCVHDVGGYTQGPQRSSQDGLKSLRTRRVLQQGIVITVQPGCYFIDFIIQKALADPEKSKYLNAEKIKEYMEVGGVRLQDDVVIRKDGVQLLSSLPRKLEEVEKILAKN